MSDAPDILGADSRPRFFPVGNAAEIGLEPPEDRLGLPVRAWIRALAGMQKEALVLNGATGRTWRLTSDEGPYLAGYDQAPCPLCIFTTGMVASYTNEITALAAARGVEIEDIELTLGNHYSMEGSALQGTMLGGAMPPELHVEIAADGYRGDLDGLVTDAVKASPVNGLLDGVLDGQFSLSRNGDRLPVGAVAPLEGGVEPDPVARFDDVRVADLKVAEDLVVRVKPADQIDGVPGGINSSLQESQRRTLHVQARCRVREDGVKVIHQNLYRPIGSEFQFLSDEAPAAGGGGKAPDAISYIAAGLGFCFMTQIGRYASITKKQLDGYRIVQDTHFSPGGASIGDGEPGRAHPVETHLHLVTPEDEEFARKALDMGERTCFLHATCRTDLGVTLAVSVRTS